MRRRDIIPWWSKAAQKAEVFGLDFKIFKELWYWCWFGKERKKKQTRICGKFGISQRILQKGTSAFESEVLFVGENKTVNLHAVFAQLIGSRKKS